MPTRKQMQQANQMALVAHLKDRDKPRALADLTSEELHAELLTVKFTTAASKSAGGYNYADLLARRRELWRRNPPTVTYV
jgi:hypothetical protein